MGCVHSKISNEREKSEPEIVSRDVTFQEEEDIPSISINPGNDDETDAFVARSVRSNFVDFVSDIDSETSASAIALQYNFLDFTAIKILGRGQSSVVVKMAKNGFIYAVKICDLTKFTPNFLHSVTADPKAEAVILKNFDFPYVIKMYDFYEDCDSNRLFIVMEFMDGGNIGRCRTNQEKRRAFSQLSMAVKYIHEQRIVHRDIKIENILRSRDGSVRLADFGVSAFIEKNVDKIKLENKGTPAYQAPEVYDGGVYNPFLVDIWALGITLYKLIFDQFPFMAQNIKELSEKIRKEEVQFPDNADKNLIDLIKKILQKDPEKRLSIDDILNHPWVSGASVKLPQESSYQQQLYANITETDLKVSIKKIMTSRNLKLHRKPIVTKS